MKNTIFLLYLSVSIFILMTTSCERTDIQKSSTNQSGLISPRADDCEDCSVGCCCCSIEALNPLPMSLSFCGTCDDGALLCGPFSPASPCSTFSGVVKSINFTSSHTRDVFCVPEGGSFRILNTTSGQTVTFRFTCRPDETPPTYINVTLKPDEFKFFHNDGSCIAAGCN